METVYDELSSTHTPSKSRRSLNGDPDELKVQRDAPKSFHTNEIRQSPTTSRVNESAYPSEPIIGYSLYALAKPTKITRV
jgi:phosphatidate phosphatase APP1